MKGNGVRVTREDLGLADMVQTLKDAARLKVRIGIQGPEADFKYPRSKATLAEVATYNEFGTRSIPARSFIRRTAFEDRGEISRAVARAFKREFKGKRRIVANALADVGADVQGMIRHKLDTSKTWAKPNAASTIARKGSDQPLLETGKLRRSISYRVESPKGTIRKG